MSQVARRGRLILLALLVLGGAAAGLGFAVNATRDTPPQIRPYDPHW
jgi:hypothetical protein